MNNAKSAAWMAYCKGLAVMGNRDAGEHRDTFESWWLSYGILDVATLESQLSTLQQRLAEVERERDGLKAEVAECHMVMHDVVLTCTGGENTGDDPRIAARKLADANDENRSSCALFSEHLVELSEERDLAIKERDELKQECARLRRLTLADEERLKLEGDAMHAEAELSKWQPVIEAAKAWREDKYPRVRSWLVEEDDSALVSAIDTAISSALTPAADGQKEK